jgi:hypothetical protein
MSMEQWWNGDWERETEEALRIIFRSATSSVTTLIRIQLGLNQCPFNDRLSHGWGTIPKAFT